MAIHLTPTELAREAGMERREVIEKCMELGVPIFQGRIDKTLFLANVEEHGALELGSRADLAARRRAPHSRIASSGSSRRSEESRDDRSAGPRRRGRRRSPT